jgi:hypothetical protein
MKTSERENDCVWEYQGEGVWDTECGDSFIILEDTPHENNMEYCPFCGRELQEFEST